MPIPDNSGREKLSIVPPELRGFVSLFSFLQISLTVEHQMPVICLDGWGKKKKKSQGVRGWQGGEEKENQSQTGNLNKDHDKGH